MCAHLIQWPNTQTPLPVDGCWNELGPTHTNAHRGEETQFISLYVRSGACGGALGCGDAASHGQCAIEFDAGHSDGKHDYPQHETITCNSLAHEMGLDC